MTNKKSASKKKAKAKVTSGCIYIQSTYNNTVISATDKSGNVLAWSSAGAMGFKGAKKSTPYAAQVVVENLMEKLKNTGLKEAVVYVKGIGGAREAAIRALSSLGLIITLIKDITPIPYNGCRPRKPRRV